MLAKMRLDSLLISLIVFLILGSTAHAHIRSESFSELTVVGDEVSGVISVKARELTRIPYEGEKTLTLLADNLGARTNVTAQGVACTTIKPAAPWLPPLAMNVSPSPIPAPHQRALN
jgi:hypothetical protein